MEIEVLRPQYSITPTFQSLLLKPAEHLQRVLVENLRPIIRREPRDFLDVRPHVVVPFTGARIGFRASAGPFSAE